MITTLCLLVKKNKVLLARRRKRTFGFGTWNGFGGKVEPNESIIEAAIRELRDETGGITTLPEQLSLVARIDFTFTHDPEWNQDLHVFLVKQWHGTAVGSLEMAKPRWIPFTKVPYQDMWPADRFWMRRVLKNGELIRGVCRFTDIKSKKIEHYVFAPVKKLTLAR